MYTDFIYKLLSIPGLVLFFSFRGYFQAWVAKKLGDRTPEMSGFLTMNPKAHIDLFGFICMLLIGFGFGKSIRFDSRNYKNPKRDGALQVLSAPASGIILAFFEMTVYYIIVAIVQALGLTANTVVIYLLYIIQIAAYDAAFLTVFLFLPLPGFDGYRLIANFLPYKYYRVLYSIEKYSMFIFIGFVILLNIPVIGTFISTYLISIPSEFILTIVSLPGMFLIKLLF